MPTVSPGEILREEFMEPLGLDEQTLAHETGIPLEILLGILNYRDAITPKVAEILACRFENSSEFWLNLQRNYEKRLVKFTTPGKRASKSGIMHPDH
jgi:addiction module HigA family antidote